MSRAWMPFYVGDFLADTMHLGATERGIYISLIMHAWQHEGTIPLDDRKLALISRCDPRQWHRWKQTVLQFFDPVNAVTAAHSRVVTELHRCAEISNKRKDAAEHLLSKRAAKSEQLLTQSQSQSQLHIESKKDIQAVAKATRLSDQEIKFQVFREVYPKRKGSNPWQPARKLWDAAVKRGENPEIIISAVKAGTGFDPAQIGTEFIPQAVKWLRDQRWKDFQPEPDKLPNEPPPGAPSDAELRAKYEQKSVQDSSQVAGISRERNQSDNREEGRIYPQPNGRGDGQTDARVPGMG